MQKKKKWARVQALKRAAASGHDNGICKGQHDVFEKTKFWNAAHILHRTENGTPGWP